MTNVRNAQIRRTKLFFEDRKQFLSLLHSDLNKAKSISINKSKKLAIRLNIDSDIPWESVDKKIFEYADYYYDYTKNPRRIKKYLNGSLPDNYHLTFSYNENVKNEDFHEILSSGGNIAVIFDVLYKPGKSQDSLPSTYLGYHVVDGDLDDLRLPSTDGTGVVVGLRAKMRKDLVSKYIKEGLVVKV